MLTDSKQDAPGAGLPFELKVFAGLSLLFSALSLVRVAIMSARHGFRAGFAPLWMGNPGFDFYDYIPRIHLLHTAGFFNLPGYPWYYAAPGAPLYAFFYLFCFGGSNRIGLAFFALFAGILCLFTAVKFISAMVTRGLRPAHAVGFVGITLLTSWPIYFSLQRGNLESVLWFGLALALWAIAGDRWTVAAVLLGAIGAVKIYPAICFALFLRQRKWKELCFGALTMAAVTVASLRYINRSITYALHGTLIGMRRWTEDYATHGLNPLFDHSFFQLMKAAAFHFHRPDGELLKIYMPVLAGTMLIVFFGRIINLPLANQVLFLGTAAVCLPPASFDYTLQNMYVPFGWLVLLMLKNKETRARWSVAVFSLFAVVFAPMTFLVLRGFTFPGLAKGAALVGLILISILKPMPKKPLMKSSS